MKAETQGKPMNGGELYFDTMGYVSQSVGEFVNNQISRVGLRTKELETIVKKLPEKRSYVKDACQYDLSCL